jgi:FKBP-type peptidyl-prolyl cis-trans isomerase SlyD
MTIKLQSVVAIHYTLTDEDGVEIDSSRGQNPLTYLHGGGNIIPGLERALVGKQAGDKLQVKVAAADAYGEFVEEMVQSVPLSAFGEDAEVTVGMRFRANTGQGELSVVVTSVEADVVTVDGNHPLAGKNLHFDVDVIAVRDATAVELTHGHVHGPGGHNH